MKVEFTTQQRLTLFNDALDNIAKGHIELAEQKLKDVIDHSFQQHDYKMYATAILKQLQLLTYEHRYSDMYHYIERLKRYMALLSEEERLRFSLYQAGFHYAFGIGQPIDELLRILDELSTMHHTKLTKQTLNRLLNIYYDQNLLQEGMDLYDAYSHLLEEMTFDEQFTNDSFIFAVNAFRLFYIHEDDAYCKKILLKLEQAPAHRLSESSKALYWSCKALYEIRRGNLPLATAYFDKFYTMLQNPYFFLKDIELWITALTEKNQLEAVVHYQNLALHALKQHVKLEEHAKRTQIVEEMSKQFYEERLYTDHLTNVKNRSFYDTLLTTYEHVTNFTVAIVDIDNFKEVNDTHGHMIGDQAIRFIAKILRDWQPHENISIIRYGGDEFVIVLPFPYKQAKSMIEKLHTNLLETPFQLRENHEYLHLSASIGIGYTYEKPESIESLFQMADAALYEAKTKKGHIIPKQSLL